jgi:ribosomal protein S18 acetylase RimI-like enzyme
MTILPENLSLRPASHEDGRLVCHIKAAAFRQYHELVWGPWDDADQARAHEQHMPFENVQIALLDGAPVAFLETGQREDAVWLLNLHVLPEFQNRGIGTHLTRHFLHWAQAQALPARLHVLKVNPAARRLYERLGFHLIAETDTHFRLQCPPPSDDPPAAALP